MFHAVNINEVELEKSGRGFTQYLMRSEAQGQPTIQIRNWGPETNIPIHKHPFNEMFYVLEGEVEMGEVNYKAGSCIFIEKGTEYGPTRSPKGCKVLRYAEGRST